MKTSIRLLTFWEVHDTMELARMFHAEAGFGAPFCPEAYQGTMSLPDVCAVGMFLHDGARVELVGALVGLVSRHFMTEDVLASELMWYVLPDYRGLGGAVSMVAMFEEAVRARGATACSMVELEKFLGAGALYTRLGYLKTESHYLKFFH